MNKPENIISIKVENGALNISVPIDLLAFAAENDPKYPLIIHDKQKFAEVIAEYLAYDENPETGLTKLMDLLDKATYEVSCDGHDFIEEKDIENH